ncbi:MAG: oligosaccharide flippase family protein [Methanotrichaceae archaeon]|nr:oligosaccharide flippase family protein [Methanotrichaceae archaeon]
MAAYRTDSLYENSFFIFLGRSLSAFCGLIFWTLATQYYSPSEIGVATALISSLGLVLSFSKLGFDISLIKFIPIMNKSRVFSSSFFIISISSIFISILFLFLIEFISPQISFIREYSILFIFFAFLSSVTFITGTTFVSIRKSRYYFLQSVLESSRILLLIPMATLGAVGIFFSQGISTIFSSFFAVYSITKFINIELNLDRTYIKRASKLSFTNYISNLSVDIPTYIIPLMLLNLLGPEDVSLYFIATTLGTSIYLMLPDAISKSFFVESSHGFDMRRGLIKSLTIAYLVLAVEFISIIFFGPYILGLLGHAYIEAFKLLRIYLLTGFFSIVYMLFMPVLNIKLLYSRNIELNLLRLVLLLGLGYVLAGKFGFVGIGYAWAIVEVTSCLLILYWINHLKIIKYTAE